MRRAIAATLVLAVVALVAGYALAQGEPRLVRVRDDGLTRVSESMDGLPGCWQIGRWVYRVEGTDCTPTTTTTTAAPTTTTAAPTTTEATTTTTQQPTTTAPATGGFVETFSDGEGWRDRFDTFVHHRADHDNPPNPVETSTWRADHDEQCGGADTFRTIDGLGDRSQHFYACRDHMMTSMGDIDGYSVLAFSPKQTFATVSRVCWDQNVTDLGGRQWTEVVVTPAALIPNGEITHVNPDFESVDNTATHHGQGTVGIKIMQDYDGFRAYVSRRERAFEPWTGWDAEGFESRAIRREHCLTDNGNGTLTMSVDRGADGTWSHSFPGSFPADARVVFEDHNYTPDKDGEACRTTGSLSGCRYTWHWDNIIIDA